MPELLSYAEDREFVFVHRDDDLSVQDAVLRIAKGIPESQVLTPMHKGPLGTVTLNEMLQVKINENPLEKLNGKTFALQDKVIQLKNNYDKEVFNGDSGTVVNIDRDSKIMTVFFTGQGNVEYTFADLDQLALAYAITIHKSQGSEYPTVIIPLIPGFHIMLVRNLVYTGITRGKQRVVIVGSPKALSQAVKNNNVAKRYSMLQDWI
jgi:exodeoxyribonuclease V alpha subunit